MLTRISQFPEDCSECNTMVQKETHGNSLWSGDDLGKQHTKETEKRKKSLGVWSHTSTKPLGAVLPACLLFLSYLK